jgi:hypothetical protein
MFFARLYQLDLAPQIPNRLLEILDNVALLAGAAAVLHSSENVKAEMLPSLDDFDDLVWIIGATIVRRMIDLLHYPLNRRAGLTAAIRFASPASWPARLSARFLSLRW